MAKKSLVCGAGGFIGSHLVKRLKEEGDIVVGADLKEPEFGYIDNILPDKFLIGDLRSQEFCDKVFGENYDEVYQLAADMGGAGYLFTGDHDADVLHNSALINLNIVERCVKMSGQIKTKVFYSSSACMYPAHNQTDPRNPKCAEDSAYPADPDSEYGWEKLFSERLYSAYHRNYGLDIAVARLHNIFGPYGSYNNGREKAPAALSRKIAEASEYIVVWGDGQQTRSFLYIDECVEGVRRLMKTDWHSPVNIGSEEMVTISNLAEMIMGIAGKKLRIEHDLSGPQGVRGRNSDNTLLQEVVGWKPEMKLHFGLESLYAWVEKRVSRISIPS